MQAGNATHRIVVIGAGFAGLSAVQKLHGTDAEITLIDRENHHLFQPLLYQAAMTVLPVSDIAWPVRTLVHSRRQVRVLQDEVTGVDPEARKVTLRRGAALEYDTLVIATGSVTSYFGNDGWAPHAPGLKTARDVLEVRTRVLAAFEEAEQTDDPERRRALLTFAVVGGGPTGVELAGMLAHLCGRVLKDEFRRIDPAAARILLIEGAPRILGPFDETLAGYAAGKLRALGVEVMTGTQVSRIDAAEIAWGEGAEDRLPCATVIWAAGVAASPAADWLGAEADKGKRVKVAPDLTLPGHPEVFVIGDTAAVPWTRDKTVPGLAPAAKQMGSFAGKTIRARLAGRRPPGPFRYRHFGSLATIGQRAAVIEYGHLRLSGLAAWWLWGLAHIFFLITLRSRAAVLLNWSWFTLFGRNGARLILKDPEQ